MKKTMFLLFFMFSVRIFAQTNLEEVVYLKDGGSIRGTILEQIPNDKITIQTKDGSVFVYKYDVISKITKEPVFGISAAAYSENQDINLKKHKSKGIGLLTAGSICFGVGFPFLVIGPLYGGFGATLSGAFLTAASIPMLTVGGIHIKKHNSGTQSKVYFSPNIGTHDQVGLHLNDKSKGISIGASVNFTF